MCPDSSICSVKPPLDFLPKWTTFKMTEIAVLISFALLHVYLPTLQSVAMSRHRASFSTLRCNVRGGVAAPRTIAGTLLDFVK